MDLRHPFQVITPTVDGDVLEVLAGAEAGFTAPQVHRLIGEHSESGVRKALKRLQRQGIVRATRAGQAWIFELNRAHLAAEHVVALAGLRRALVEKAGDAISGWSTTPEYAALFGSAAKGGMRVDSDIDLFVVRPDATDIDDAAWRHDLDALASAVSAWTGNDTQILEFSASEVAAARRKKSDRVLRDIADEGITLFGTDRYLHRKANKR
jgi:predicted nucleotidyltransferase